MIVMTDGLKALAGNAMRTALMRLTHSPLSGAVTGAATTAVLQSSSATTVATIGFVGAGLISFSAALGIVFGANVGTTVTGWLVAILGFKLKLGTVVLPLIFIGSSLRLFTHGKWAKVGLALAGFGLIFVGIAAMQDAMGGLTGIISPDRLPSDTWWGRLQLVMLGIVTTVITQSSSAGVAATLTALYAGAVNFPQAAALVIGMDVGTTVTAVLATLGGSINARRTGLAHVIYNLWTATLALLFLSPYTWLWEQFAPGQLVQNAELGLVAFHTCFNILGVAAILPFTRQFAQLIIRVMPGQGATYTDGLSEGLLEQPPLALNAVQAAIQAEFIALLGHLLAILGSPDGQRVDLAELQTGLDETHSYLDHIHLKTGVDPDWERLLNMIHALDHLQRVHERCEEDEDRAITVQTTLDLTTERQALTETIQTTLELVQANQWGQATRGANQVVGVIHKKVRPYREATMALVGRGQIDVAAGTGRLEAMRWLRRVSKHIDRICYHMDQALLAMGK
jgi:phosphate:Na+ symporter